MLEGRSPYELAAFQGCWEASLGVPFRSSFVFPPTSLPYAALLGAFSWEGATVVADAFNLLGFILLAIALVRLVKPSLQRRLSYPVSAAWLLAGLTSSGVLGAIFVGQGSVLVAASLAWFFVGVRDAKPGPFVLGTLFATVKPQLSTMALAYGWLSKPRRLWLSKMIAVAVGGAAAVSAWAAFPGLAADYRESLSHHAASRFTGLAGDERLYGLPDLLQSGDHNEKFALIIAILWFGVVWYFAGRWKRAEGGVDSPEIVALVTLAGLFCFPVKVYDFAVLSIVFAMVGAMQFRLQLVLALPMLVLWRPVVGKWLSSASANVSAYMVVNTAMLVVLATLSASLLRARGSRNRSAEVST